MQSHDQDHSLVARVFPETSVLSRNGSAWYARRDLAVGVVFLLSGVAALFYQIAWQRLLFASFGIDIESVTIIVSTFMLGLGVGALAGGYLADRFPTRLLALFALFEAAIGTFGLVSAPLIVHAGVTFVDATRSVVALVNFALLLIPTSLMGATLPVLTAEAARRSGGVGISIGRLYFVNTLGAATAALLLGVGLFAVLGLREVITVAVSINFAAALGAAAVAIRSRR